MARINPPSTPPTPTDGAPATDGAPQFTLPADLQGTVLNKKGKPMSFDEKVKITQQRERKAALEQKKREKAEAQAAAKAAREAAKNAPAEERAARLAAAKTAAKEQDDALKAEADRLGLKIMPLRLLLKGQRFLVTHVPATEATDEAPATEARADFFVTDAKGEHPVTLEDYLATYVDDVTRAGLARPAKAAPKPAGPRAERAPRAHPSDEGVVRTSGRELAVAVDPAQPWAALGVPAGVALNIQDARFEQVRETGPAPEGEEPREVVVGYRLITPDGQENGILSTEALRDVGWSSGFKVDTVKKIEGNPALAAEFINYLVAGHRPQRMTFTEGPDGRINTVLPAWREVASDAEVAQTAFDKLAATYGDVAVSSVQATERGFYARFLLPAVQEEVTLAVGDVLSGGIEVWHRPGNEIIVSVFTERLACLNGMTVKGQAFSWTSRQAGSIADQLKFVAEAIDGAMRQFAQLVERARQMATTPVAGDPHAALRDRARAMGLDASLLARLIAAYELEPGLDEWHLLNAFTRLATHEPTLRPGVRRAIEQAAGDWALGFDAVTARLPRAIAQRVGATILAEGDEA